LHATFVRLPGVPGVTVQTERVVSYTLPIVETVTAPLVVDVSDHHTVLVRGFVLGIWAVKAQGGVGSVDSVVAAELSTVLVKLLVVIAIAFAMLSLTGGVPFTVKDFEADDSPAFAASSVTVTEAIVPYATRAGEIVALIEVAVPPCIATPSVEPFQRICAFVAKLLPVAVRVNAGEPAEIEGGLIELSVGVDPAPVLMLDQALTRLKASIEPSPVV